MDSHALHSIQFEVFQLEIQIVPPPQQLNPAPVMAEPIPHVAEDSDWLSYLANHPAAQTIFESKVVVEDRNTKACLFDLLLIRMSRFLLMLCCNS